MASEFVPRPARPYAAWPNWGGDSRTGRGGLTGTGWRLERLAVLPGGWPYWPNRAPWP